MGRKSQSKGAKTKSKHNPSRQERELEDNIDTLLKLCTSVQDTNVLKALEHQKEIEKTIQKVNTLQNHNKSNLNVGENDSRYTSDTIDKFTNWVRENGAIFEGCSICNFTGYDLGLKTNSDIGAGSLVLAVPRKLMLTLENAKMGPLKDLIEHDHILSNMPNVALAIFLLVEKFKENSFYKPYIDILPTRYSTVLYFSVDELEELKGSPLLEVALRQIKSIARQYAYFHTIFRSGKGEIGKLLKDVFSFEEYRWAVSTVMTRQNTIPSEDGSQMTNVLIPLWDLCNHTNGRISTDYNPELNRSECLALRDFKKDDQLFIFYGARNNADLFIHNGFVYEDNEFDSYFIRLGISKSDPLRQKRELLLKKNSIETISDFCIKRNFYGFDGRLIAFLRIFNMDESQLDHWIESEKSSDLQFAECALDTALEKKSLTFLRARLQLLLASYKTSLEEDHQLIKETKASSNSVLAIRMRSTEKSILKNALLTVENLIKQ